MRGRSSSVASRTIIDALRPPEGRKPVDAQPILVLLVLRETLLAFSFRPARELRTFALERVQRNAISAGVRDSMNCDPDDRAAGGRRRKQGAQPRELRI